MNALTQKGPCYRSSNYIFLPKMLSPEVWAPLAYYTKVKLSRPWRFLKSPPVYHLAILRRMPSWPPFIISGQKPTLSSPQKTITNIQLIVRIKKETFKNPQVKKPTYISIPRERKIIFFRSAPEWDGICDQKIPGGYLWYHDQSFRLLFGVQSKLRSVLCHWPWPTEIWGIPGITHTFVFVQFKHIAMKTYRV